MTRMSNKLFRMPDVKNPGKDILVDEATFAEWLAHEVTITVANVKAKEKGAKTALRESERRLSLFGKMGSSALFRKEKVIGEELKVWINAGEEAFIKVFTRRLRAERAIA